MSRTLSFFIFAVMAIFFGCFFAYPIWMTVRVAFETPDHHFTLEFIGEVFQNQLYREGLYNSFTIAFWTTLGCLLIALPLAVLFVSFEFPGKTLLNSLVLTPMVLPPFVGAIGIKAMLGQAGALNSLLMNLGLMSRQQPVDWLGDGQMPGIVIMEVLHLYPLFQCRRFIGESRSRFGRGRCQSRLPGVETLLAYHAAADHAGHFRGWHYRLHLGFHGTRRASRVRL